MAPSCLHVDQAQIHVKYIMTFTVRRLVKKQVGLLPGVVYSQTHETDGSSKQNPVSNTR